MAGSEVAAGPNPYVGPRPFEPGERLWGRDDEVAALYYLLSAERVVLLYSPSGAGKSSLVQAGLIPRLRQRFDVWRPTRVNQEPAVAEPGGRPVNRYAQSAILGFEEGIPRELRRPPAEVAGLTLAEYAAGRPRRPQAPQSAVLIFDQFEEVLTVDPLDVAAKREFFDQLGELLRDSQIWALFALREDYLAPLDPYAERVPTHLKNRFRIDLLGLAAAREAIVNPAREGGREFPAADRLIHDLATMKIQQPDGSFRDETGNHVEPVQLQVVCRRLWDAMPADDLTIDAEDLGRFGDVTGALAAYYADAAGRIAAGNPSRERAIRDWFGEALITAGGIRRQVLREAGASGGLANDVIDELRETHLVRAEKRAGATWYELAHDRLISPVRSDNAAWREEHLSAVQRRAALWEAQGRPAGLLLTAEELAEGRAWAAAYGAGLTETEQRFLAASGGVVQARRTRKLAFAAAMCAVLFLLLGGFAWLQWRQANEDRMKAIDLSREAVAGSLLSIGETTKADLTLLEVLRPDARPATSSALRRALQAVSDQPVAILEGHENWLTSVAFSPDGRRVVTASADRTARLWDAKTGKPAGEPMRHQGSVNSASFSPDGLRVVTASADGTVRLWDAGMGKPLGELMSHGPAVNAAAFSPDGERVVTACDDGEAQLLDATTGELLRSPLKRDHGVLSASFSRDGSRILTASSDMAARIWDAGKGTETELGDHMGCVVSASYSPDGQRIVTAAWDETARIWDAGTGRQLVLLNGSFSTASFSPDGSRLVTTSDDRTAQIWNAATGEPIATLRGQGVAPASFNRDGSLLVTASVDRTAHIYDTRPAEVGSLPSGVELQSRIRARTGLCLDAGFRESTFGESREEAKRKSAACEKCVPEHRKRLDLARSPGPRDYLEAWDMYQNCLKQEPDHGRRKTP